MVQFTAQKKKIHYSKSAVAKNMDLLWESIIHTCLCDGL